MKYLLPLAIFMGAFYILDALRINLQINYLYVDRIILWIVPTFLFIKLYLRQDPIKYVKLNTNIKKGVFWGIAISIVHSAIYCAFWYMMNGVVSINWSAGFRIFLDVVVIASIIEEIVFRGFVLEYLRNIYDFKTANIISSLLFMIAHIPYFIAFGYFSFPPLKITYEFLRLFAFGLLWGFMVKKTNSLWPSIIHHSANNFLAFMVK